MPERTSSLLDDPLCFGAFRDCSDMIGPQVVPGIRTVFFGNSGRIIL
jgi:hypothetical protein